MCFEIADNMEESIIEGSSVPECTKKLETKIINQYDDKVTILRLLILLSLTQNCMSRTDFNNIRKIFIASYGFDEIMLLNNLQEARLLAPKDTLQTFSWKNVK